MSFFIDVQGTLLSDKDKSLIDGSKEILEFLNNQNLPYIVITNNTKKPSEFFLNELREKNLPIKNGAYLDPFCVLKQIISPCEVACFGADEFKNTMEKLNYKLEYKNPKAVLIASGENFEFKEFAQIIDLVQNGAKLIAMHATSIYKKNSYKYPGVGAICAMIKEATGANFEIVGKPSDRFYKEALNLIKKQNNNLNFSDISIISDDFRGDLLGAKKLNMKINLVLSGKIENIKILGDDSKICDGIFENIGDFLRKILCKN